MSSNEVPAEEIEPMESWGTVSNETEYWALIDRLTAEGKTLNEILNAFLYFFDKVDVTNFNRAAFFIEKAAEMYSDEVDECFEMFRTQCLAKGRKILVASSSSSSSSSEEEDDSSSDSKDENDDGPPEELKPNPPQ